jgi:tetratricopeptide (TPR) repeat protein
MSPWWKRNPLSSKPRIVPRESHQISNQRAVAFYQQGRLAYSDGDYLKSIKLLNEAIALEPHAVGYDVLGGALHRLLRLPESAIAYETAARLNPADTTIINRLANVYMAAGRWDDAQKVLSDTLQHEQTADLWFNLGCVYSGKRMYGRAIDAQRHALSIDPNDLDALYNLGVDLHNQFLEEGGKRCFDEAIEALTKCLALDPSQTDVRRDLRRLQDSAGTSDPAEKDLPDSEGAFEELGVGAIIPLRDGFYQYRIEDIKRGGMGVVYIARNLKTHDVGAIKTFLGRTRTDQRTLDRFAREARTWIELTPHPNIVTAEYVEQLGNRLMILLDYIDGSDLGALITEKKLTPARVLDFAIQFCSGMSAAYQERRLIHRDIKPANILVTRNGVVKITDFGLAKSVAVTEPAEARSSTASLSSSLNVTLTGAAMGTPPYMAPEQFLDTKSATVSSDVYAFGVTLFQALTGRLPFTGSSIAELRSRHLSEKAPRLRTFAPHLPQELDDLVFQCLDKSPSRRPADFATLKPALVSVYRRVSGGRYVELDQRSGQYRAIGSSGYSSLMDKGHSLLHLGDAEAAMMCFEKAASLNPDREAPLLALAQCCRELRRLDEAISYADRALKMAPKSSQIWKVKGVLLGFALKLDEALPCLDRGLELDPLDHEILVNKAAFLSQLERNEEAIACCDSVPAESRHSAAALTNKATVLWKQGHHQAALQCVDRALTLEPNHREARANRNMYELEIADAAKPDAQRVAGWLNHGRVLFEARDFSGAAECFEEAIAVDAESAEAWAALGNCHFDEERYEEAFPCFSRATVLAPQEKQALISCGSSLANLGRFDEALAYFDRAALLSPDDDEIAQYRRSCRAYLEKGAT